MRPKDRLRTLACALALGATTALPGVAHADGEATFGTQTWHQSVPEAKFREYRDVPQGAFLESFLLRGGNDRFRSMFYGKDALQNDELLGLRLDRGIRLQIDGTYKRQPHNISLIARSPYTEVSPGVYLLPDSLQRANQEDPGAYLARMTDLMNNAPHVGVGFRTDESKVRVRARPSQGLQFEFTGMRRDRTGNKPYGAAFGFNSAIELPEPIDQRVWDGTAAAHYQRGKVSARFLVGASAFDNHVDVLRWDNPKRITDRTYSSAYVAGDGSAQGLIDLYPSNEAIRGQAGFVARLPHQATFSADLSLSRMTQNDPWQKFTVNTAIPDSVLNTYYTSSARSTDAKAIRLNQDYRLSGKVAGGLRGTVRYHQNHYDDQTPEFGFRSAVRLDGVAENGSSVGDSLFLTKPFSNDQKTTGLDLRFAKRQRVQLSGTIEYRQRRHSEREVAKDNETYAKLTSSFEPVDDVHLSLGVYQGIRVHDSFILEDYQKGENPDSVFVELAGLRRFDVANRHQRGADADLDVTLSDHVDVGALFQHQQNRFPETVYGLQYLESNEGLGQATLHATDRLDVSGGYGVQRVVTRQLSNETNSNAPPTPDAATDWQAQIVDLNQYVFTDWSYRATQRLRMRAGYTFSRDQASYDLSNGTNTAQDLPDTFYRRQRATFEAQYRLSGGTELGARYGYDKYDVVDFAAQDIQLLGLTAGAATAIYLGDNALDYQAHQVALLVTRRF
ncbi:MAG: MtrB/PioB family outer membrane beta-barrel protein [Candidatus Eisenbacteria bacterium]